MAASATLTSAQNAAATLSAATFRGNINTANTILSTSVAQPAASSISVAGSGTAGTAGTAVSSDDNSNKIILIAGVGGAICVAAAAAYFVMWGSTRPVVVPTTSTKMDQLGEQGV